MTCIIVGNIRNVAVNPLFSRRDEDDILFVFMYLYNAIVYACIMMAFDNAVK